MGEFDLLNYLEQSENPDFHGQLSQFRDELKEREFFFKQKIEFLRAKIELIWIKFNLKNRQIFPYMIENLMIKKQDTYHILNNELKRCQKIVINKLKILIESKLLNIAKTNDQIVSECEAWYQKLTQFLNLWNEYFRLEESCLEEQEKQLFENIKNLALEFINSDLLRGDTKISNILLYITNN